MGTTLPQEYCYMEEKFGLSAEQKRIILAYAVDAAFTTESVKKDLRKQLGL